MRHPGQGQRPPGKIVWPPAVFPDGAPGLSWAQQPPPSPQQSRPQPRTAWSHHDPTWGNLVQKTGRFANCGLGALGPPALCDSCRDNTLQPQHGDPIRVPGAGGF